MLLLSPETTPVIVLTPFAIPPILSHDFICLTASIPCFALSSAWDLTCTDKFIPLFYNSKYNIQPQKNYGKINKLCN